MNEQQQPGGDPSRGKSTGCLPVVLRTLWMAWGNVALFLCAAKVADPAAPALTAVLLFLMAGALIGIRYIDITRFAGQTAEGEPADLSHWRRYAMGVVLLSVSLWGLASFVASRGGM